MTRDSKNSKQQSITPKSKIATTKDELALIEAVRKGNIKEIERLLAIGVNVNTSDKNEVTP